VSSTLERGLFPISLKVRGVQLPAGEFHAHLGIATLALGPYLSSGSKWVHGEFAGLSEGGHHETAQAHNSPAAQSPGS
jgi:hypothetical protein